MPAWDLKSCMSLLSAVYCSAAQSILVRDCAAPKETLLARKFLQATGRVSKEGRQRKHDQCLKQGKGEGKALQ